PHALLPVPVGAHPLRQRLPVRAAPHVHRGAPAHHPVADPTRNRHLTCSMTRTGMEPRPEAPRLRSPPCDTRSVGRKRTKARRGPQGRGRAAGTATALAHGMRTTIVLLTLLLAEIFPVVAHAETTAPRPSVENRGGDMAGRLGYESTGRFTPSIT